jgi:hypothetical protein
MTHQTALNVILAQARRGESQLYKNKKKRKKKVG